MDLNQLLEYNATEEFNQEYVMVSLFEAESLILIDWKRQVVFEERKECLLQSLKLLKQYQIKYMLINDQNIYFLSYEEKNWIKYEWVDIASSSSLLKIGVVFIENYDMVIETTDFTNQLQKRYQATGKIQLRGFKTLPGALAWLSPYSEE